MSIPPRKRIIKSIPVATAALIVCGWICDKWKMLSLVAAGVFGFASGMYAVSRPLIHHEATQDSGIIANASGIQSLATQTSTWHDERVSEQKQTVADIGVLKSGQQTAATQMATIATQVTDIRDEIKAVHEDIRTLMGRPTAASNDKDGNRYVFGPPSSLRSNP